MKLKIKTFESASGMTILVGQDDWSNDELTFSVGHPNDIWLHVNGAPGSHVLIQCGEAGVDPDKDTLKEAAGLAAWYSKLRQGGKVPVHYCRIKNISKPKRAPAGTVSIRMEKKIVGRPKLLDEVRSAKL